MRINASRIGKAINGAPRSGVRTGLLLVLSMAACDADRTTRPDGLTPNENFGAATNGVGATSSICPTCAFGPQLYTRAKGQPETHTHTFPGDPAGAYIIEIDDFGDQGANALVVLNGQGLSPPSRYTRKAVSLKANNDLRVTLTGKPGSRLKVRVFQEVHSVTVTPHLSYTRMPARQQFTAVARDANGVVIPRQTFEWRSSDLTIATIDTNTGLATTTGSKLDGVKWQYKTISTGEGTSQIVARATGTSVEGSVPWKISPGFVYITYRAALPLNSANRSQRKDPEALRYDEARLRTMADRCDVEKDNEEWWPWTGNSERLFSQCFPVLKRSNLSRRPGPFGGYIFSDASNIGLYGRYCGAGHPDQDFFHDFANVGNYEPRDPIDAVCMEHDAQKDNHELSTSNAVDIVLATCIVRYGIESEELYEDGVRIQRGSARWTAFWDAWPAMAETRRHYLIDTSASCQNGPIYDKFLSDRGLSMP
ncbi:MAG: hypothetical protein ACRENP_23115 [Longimicrobiales bacterium]